eukprot:COSAG06_NODE_1450_length_9437_cov_5.045299_11_plen_88_part_00
MGGNGKCAHGAPPPRRPPKCPNELARLRARPQQAHLATIWLDTGHKALCPVSKSAPMNGGAGRARPAAVGTGRGACARAQRLHLPPR